MKITFKTLDNAESLMHILTHFYEIQKDVDKRSVESTDFIQEMFDG